MHFSKHSILTMNLLAAVLAVLALMFSSCSKPQAPVVKEWDLYQDPFYGFELQYPKGWLVNAETNQIKIYSSQEAATWFFDPSSGGKNGVEILFGFENFATAGVTISRCVCRTNEGKTFGHRSDQRRATGRAWKRTRPGDFPTRRRSARALQSMAEELLRCGTACFIM